MRLHLYVREITATMLALLLAGCGGDVPEPVTETASAESLAAQAITAGQVQARGPSTFVCGGNPADQLTARYYNTTPAAMQVERDGTTVLLFQTISGSGAHYISGTTSFWEHQGEVALDWGNPPVAVTCKPTE
jgi:membrane-bound inhibitor of C-type lysozyme